MAGKSFAKRNERNEIMLDAYQTRDKILEYYETQLKEAELVFTPNSEADAFVKNNPLAFLFAVILDQGIKAEIAWEMSFQLRRILGNLDVYQIACLSQEKMRDVFNQLPKKPRYLPQAAERVRQAAIKVVRQYDGKAENLWNDKPRAGDLQSRFDDFKGIGQKKASMATRILGMDLQVPIRNWNELDVAVDEMIQRVFPRAGLSNTDGVQDIIDSARRLNPSFPGALDYPCWDIGRRWCKPQTPDCFSCYIDEACPKVGLE